MSSKPDGEKRQRAAKAASRTSPVGQLFIVFIFGFNALICVNNFAYAPFLYDGVQRHWKKHHDKLSSTISAEYIRRHNVEQQKPVSTLPQQVIGQNLPNPAERLADLLPRGQPPTEKLLHVDKKTTRDEYGTTWRRCAEQNSLCSCSSRTIRYGMRDRWVVIRNSKLPEAVNCSLDVLRPNTAFKPQNFKQECWCESANNAKPPARVAIVTTSNRPYNLVPWINYHLGYAGIDHVFIDLSADAQTWQSLLPSIPYRDRVTVYLKERKENYFLSGYQNYVVNAAINLSARAGIDWIVHIDDDEMLYSPAKRSVGDIFGNIPDRFEAIQIRNVEAVYESPDIKNCFSETKYFNMCGQSYVAYANGKSASRVNLTQGRHPRGLGVHTFARNGGARDLVTLRTMERNEFPDWTQFGAPLVVVHLESCPVSSWIQKYKQIAKTCEETKCFTRFIKNFAFQKKSVERMMNCSKSSSDAQCSEEALYSFWASYRVREKRRLKDKDRISPLDVPWEVIPGTML